MNVESNTEEIANSRLVPQLSMMIRALWASPVRNTLFLLSGALFIVIAATAYGQIRLNTWNQPFYDALSRKDFAQFLVQLGVFGVIGMREARTGAGIVGGRVGVRLSAGSGPPSRSVLL